MKLDIEWLDAPGVRDRVLAATWARFSFRVGDVVLTEVVDNRSKSRRTGVFGSVFPLAKWIVAILVSASLGIVVASAEGADEVTPAERLFVSKVLPLLERKCFGCHGADRENIEGGLDLTSRAGLLRGGDTFGARIVVAGDASSSVLYRVVSGAEPDYVMPPKESERLSRSEAWALRDWIKGGAPWPDAARRRHIARSMETGVPLRTSGGLADSWNQRRYASKDLWAYRPLRRPPVPSAGRSAVRHPIDAFIARRLHRAELEPAPRADRRTLIRRATFDLTGLPPTPAEVAAFLDDPRSDDEAFSAVVDRLLASPRYGEQAARYWLDLVRYADTAGLANDFERPNAWRYRDYVIRSFNDDKPYDRFVLEQVAGDELFPDSAEARIAVGFLRMGPWEQTSMSVARVTRQQFLDDVTDLVGQAFLAHPLQCTRCHDHKFDPIPTRDYYRIQAVFATTQFAEPDVPFLARENRRWFAEERAFLQRRIAHYERLLEAIKAKEEKAARAWYAERNLEYAPRYRLLKRGVPESQIAPRHIGLTVEDFGLMRIAGKYLTRHRWELDRFRPIALSVYSGKTRLRKNVQGRLPPPDDPLGQGLLETTHILPGGNLFGPADPVEPGILSCLDAVAGRTTPAASIPRAIRGRRAAFAQWLVDWRHNPLTPRAIVNRIWYTHFGRGIARNLNNFGKMGAKPTHPQLLDWLTMQFIEQGWSIKRLHRSIMLSDTYCRSVRHPRPKRLAEYDPQGDLFAVFHTRRLAAEELRDTMLAVAGLLQEELGGLPVRPEINREVALQPRQIMGTYAPAYQPSPLPQQRHRRTIYAMRIRGQRDPFAEVFNQPGLDKPCEVRESSTVAPQALTLINGRASHLAAIAWAERLLAESSSDREAIAHAFRLAYGRDPRPAEQRLCLDHWHAMERMHRRTPAPRDPWPREVRRQAVEEMSGQTFTFVERLEVFDRFVPDREAADVSPRVRGLADLCLVLFNANEFLYVD